MLGLQDLPGPLAHRCGLRSSERLHNVVFPELACSEFFRCRAWRAGAALLETLVCWLELELLALMAKALLRVTLTYFFNSCSGQSSAIKIFQGREKRQMKKKRRQEDQVHTNQSKCFWKLSRPPWHSYLPAAHSPPARPTLLICPNLYNANASLPGPAANPSSSGRE